MSANKKVTVLILLATSLTLLFQNCAQGPFGLDWNSGGSSGTSSSSSSSINIDNSYEAQAVTILQSNCTSCHTATSGPQNVYDVTDPSHLIAAGLIVPGQPG